MPTTCCVVRCGSRGDRDVVKFYKIPSELHFTHKLHLNKLSKMRRQKWIQAIKRKDLTATKLKNASVCSKHFVTGKPSPLTDEDNPDWIPSLFMGYGDNETVHKQTKICSSRQDGVGKREGKVSDFSAKVVSCDKAPAGDKQKDANVEIYEVILEDTILFPEGGGQPCDHGFLNTIPVNKVIRKGDKAIHIINEPLPIGDEVKQTIDWERRFDHMQQHSGQHLITALIDREFRFPTVSWWLGEETSYIELDTPKITEAQIKEAEDKINGLIREGKNVTVEVYSEDTPEEELKKVRARGLPEDHKGDIRVINIEDLERNMCCGTHVSNLSQLQAVKLLHSEKSKRKDKTLLYFLVGNRVLKRLSECIDREQKLVTLLKNNPAQHPELVDKLQKSVKLVTKNVQTVLKDLAHLQAMKLNDTLPVPAFFSMHRKEADPDFMNTFIRELGSRTDILLFLSTGDDKQTGNILLYGPEKDVAELGPKICEILDGKGAGKGNKFQAKVSKMVNRSKAEELIKEYFTK